ncbi:MAG: hypothetical protein IM662_02315 [Phenylobacterium sp.]|nr:hypothetical protein [Phenylobacterium sp.]
MSDWKQHDGGPQPVADDVWVERPNSSRRIGPAHGFDWAVKCRFHILNQHLIDAARLEGIRLGLEAAEQAAQEYAYQCRAGGHFEVAIAFNTHADDIRNINPETIAKETAR